MIKFHNKNVIIEGPDLSGKTTFIKSLHKSTGYKFNLIDRSYLSRVCYARQFGRDESLERSRLETEINDLNNKIIVLLPSKSLILSRFRSRGDDIQDEKSLLYLHDIYTEEVESIRDSPNVLVFRDDRICNDMEKLVQTAFDNLSSFENYDIPKIGQFIKGSVTKKNPEKILNLEIEIDPEYYTKDESNLYNKKEREYYDEIESDCYDIIKNEIEGRNYDRIPQLSMKTRRFYYSSNTCISSIHFLPRHGRLDVICSLRSTDVVRNATSDLAFLAYLSAKINWNFAWPSNKINLLVRFNNAHIRLDLDDDI
jgi:hypothetical protein